MKSYTKIYLYSARRIGIRSYLLGIKEQSGDVTYLHSLLFPLHISCCAFINYMHYSCQSETRYIQIERAESDNVYRSR